MKTRQRAKLEQEAASRAVPSLDSGEELEGYIALDGTAMGSGIRREDDPSGRPSEQRPQHQRISLCSSLDPGPTPDLYFSCDPDTMLQALVGPQATPKGGKRLLEQRDQSIMKDCVITPDFEKKDCAPPLTVSKRVREKMAKVARETTAGSKWFDMKAPVMTQQLKNDLHLLRMRNALDPSQHYKTNDSKKLPRFFQVGRVIADSTDFYSARIPRRQQKQTLVDELLANEESQKYHRKKYLELQKKFSSGTRRRRSIPLKKKFKKTIR